jgi:hypothetical protein
MGSTREIGVVAGKIGFWSHSRGRHLVDAVWISLSMCCVCITAIFLFRVLCEFEKLVGMVRYSGAKMSFAEAGA